MNNLNDQQGISGLAKTKKVAGKTIDTIIHIVGLFVFFGVLTWFIGMFLSLFEGPGEAMGLLGLMLALLTINIPLSIIGGIFIPEHYWKAEGKVMIQNLVKFAALYLAIIIGGTLLLNILSVVL